VSGSARHQLSQLSLATDRNDEALADFDRATELGPSYQPPTVKIPNPGGLVRLWDPGVVEDMLTAAARPARRALPPDLGVTHHDAQIEVDEVEFWSDFATGLPEVTARRRRGIAW
jgi:hypothetical protein